FREHCLQVASHLIVLGEGASSLVAARKLAQASLQDGTALARFRELVAAQGGDASYVDNPDKLPKALFIETVKAPKSGYVKWIDAKLVGETSVEMGAGGARKGGSIAPAVGIVVLHKVGDKLAKGEPLFVLHANSQEKLDAARQRVLAAHQWS